LKNLQKGLQARFDALPPGKRKVFNALVRINKALTKAGPRLEISRRMLKQSMKRLAENSAPSLSAALSPEPPRRCNFSTISVFLSLTDTDSRKLAPPLRSTI